MPSEPACAGTVRWCRRGGRSPWRGGAGRPRAGVKPAPTIAIRIACSWNSGTPSVLPSTCSSSSCAVGIAWTSSSVPSPPAQIGMHHVALDRARPDDRHLDDEIVEGFAASGAAASPSAPGSRSGRRRSCRRGGSCRRSPSLPAGMLARVELLALVLAQQVEGRAHAARACRAPSTSTFMKLEGVDVVLVPLDDGAVRPSPRCSIGTRSSSRLRVRTKPPDMLGEMAREADQLRATSSSAMRGPAICPGSRPARASVGVVAPRRRPAPDRGRRARRSRPPTGRRPCRPRASAERRAVADHGRGDAGAVAAVVA